MSRPLDAVVVGSGPNGLAAAITLAREGCSVLVLEAADTVGGGMRTKELTLPGFRHDVCSAIHPLALVSPFFRSLPLREHGVEFVDPPAALAHPFDDGDAAVLERSLSDTGATLGEDADAWRGLFDPLVRNWQLLVDAVLAPAFPPRHPLPLALFGLKGLRAAEPLARSRFRGQRARALFAGLAGHSLLSLRRSPSAAFGLVLGMLGHAVGWPLVRGGSQALADGLATVLRSLGGTLETGAEVRSLRDLPSARVYLFDIGPRQLADMAGDALPDRYRARLRRFRYGPGAFKLDWALDAPIPWRAPDCARAATVHLGGTLGELAHGEEEVSRGRSPERPLVLLAQQSLFDPGRAPAGKHTAWAYCHVPNGATVDMTERIEAQVERFAPGFRDTIAERHVMRPADLERYNANYVGGDVNAGAQDLRQLFTRPLARLDPYRTPAAQIYLCSASTPPGGGVHGMCGYWAAQSVLRARFSRSPRG